MKTPFKLFDADMDNDTGKIAITEITVLEEGVLEGASEPSYLVQYPDGSRARCSRGMYHPTQEAALESLASDLSESIEGIATQLSALERQRDIETAGLRTVRAMLESRRQTAAATE